MFILCGPPGVGKSTTAKAILGSSWEDNVCEADEWFTLSNTQKEQFVKFRETFFLPLESYRYVREEIATAHDFCKAKATKIMTYPEPLVVANTSCSKWEKLAYIELAKKYGYEISVLVVDKHHQGTNTKGLDTEIVDNFYRRFEFLDPGYSK
jgi:predicted kinase